MIQANRPYLAYRIVLFIIEIKLNTCINSDQHETCDTAEYLQTFSPILYNLV